MMRDAPPDTLIRAGAHTSTHAPTLRALFEECGRVFPVIATGKKPATWLSSRVLANLEAEANEQKAVLARTGSVRQDWGRRGPAHGFLRHLFHDGRHFRANSGLFIVLRKAPGMVWIRLAGFVAPGHKPPDVQREVVLTVRLGNSAAVLDRAYGMEPVIVVDGVRVHFAFKKKDTWNLGGAAK